MFLSSETFILYLCEGVKLGASQGLKDRPGYFMPVGVSVYENKYFCYLQVMWEQPLSELLLGGLWRLKMDQNFPSINWYHFSATVLSRQLKKKKKKLSEI